MGEVWNSDTIWEKTDSTESWKHLQKPGDWKIPGNSRERVICIADQPAFIKRQGIEV